MDRTSQDPRVTEYDFIMFLGRSITTSTVPPLAVGLDADSQENLLMKASHGPSANRTCHGHIVHTSQRQVREAGVPSPFGVGRPPTLRRTRQTLPTETGVPLFETSRHVLYPTSFVTQQDLLDVGK